MRAKISNLYSQSKAESKPLLGSNTFDFWQPYIEGSSVYDRYFKDHFSGFYYFNNFSDTATTSEIFDDFTDAVQAFITLNSKRYSELFRVHVLPDSAYDVVNNYDLNETHTRTASGSGSNVSGEREDTQTGSSVEGARTDSGSTNTGAQNTTTTRSIEGFNSSSFSDSNKDATAAAAHTDTTNVSKGEQRDSNSSTLNKGAQTDTHTSNETENITIRRYGNIGVQTPADVIGGHIELWNLFNFYKQVFDEIAKEYLLLDDDYIFESSSGGGASDDQILTAIAELSAKVTAGFEAGAKSSQITGLATTSQLNDGVENIREDIADVRSDMTNLDTTVNSIALDVSALRGSSLVYKNEIIGSIEGVSTNEY